MVVDTGTWLPGKRVLVAPHWIARVSWERAQVDIDLQREAVAHSPAFDPAAPVNRQYEARLYDYYGRPVYWASGAARRGDERGRCAPAIPGAPPASRRAACSLRRGAGLRAGGTGRPLFGRAGATGGRVDRGGHAATRGWMRVEDENRSGQAVGHGRAG